MNFFNSHCLLSHLCMHGYVEEVRVKICFGVGTKSIYREYERQDSLFGLTNFDIYRNWDTRCHNLKRKQILSFVHGRTGRYHKFTT
jgi:hypothetical protein